MPAQWVSYDGSNPNRKPYTCGKCHTTGWLDFTENGGVNQDGLPGILGTWEETGIRCERCHFPGVNPALAGGGHVVSQLGLEQQVNRRSELCGECYFRDTNHNILASGGFIRHHEQFDELINGVKRNFLCTMCHDPHVGVRYGNAAAGEIVQTCQDCHPAVTVDHLGGDVCEDCHMARASPSARSVHINEGDVRTHIFAINPNPVLKDGMFFVDPESGATHTRGFVTLDFACYSCHDNPDTPDVEGTIATTTPTLAELAAKAVVIHQ